jgi:hypothetical protein
MVAGVEGHCQLDGEAGAGEYVRRKTKCKKQKGGEGSGLIIRTPKERVQATEGVESGEERGVRRKMEKGRVKEEIIREFILKHSTL